MPTLEQTLLIPLPDYRTQADRHGIRVKVTVKVPSDVFMRLMNETDNAHLIDWNDDASMQVVTIGGVRFETERT